MPKLFSDEQMELARSVRLEDYLKSHEPGNMTVRERYDEIRLKDHDSLVLTISNDIFHWKSQNIGGKGALDFLVKVRDYDFKEAVRLLLLDSHLSISHCPSTMAKSKTPTERPIECKPFELPPRSNSVNSTIKYLLGRGIDSDNLNECISKGSIYQTMYFSEKANRSFSNAVFVGYDWSSVSGSDLTGSKSFEDKTAKFAAIRSTFGNFKQDAAGSDKSYGFLLPAHQDSTAVSVFESPIDALSGATVAKMKNRNSYKKIHRLSLGGVSDLALKRFLKDFPNVHTVNLCLDNDEAGRNACKSISKMLAELGRASGKTYKINMIPPKWGKDYNEMLIIGMSKNAGQKNKMMGDSR